MTSDMARLSEAFRRYSSPNVSSKEDLYLYRTISKQVPARHRALKALDTLTKFLNNRCGDGRAHVPFSSLGK
jgi:hypothetical protein